MGYKNVKEYLLNVAKKEDENYEYEPETENKGFTFVFVYGTLKKGYGNHHYMERAGGKLIGKGKTAEKYCLYSNGFIPFLKTEPQKNYIQGEVYAIPVKNIEITDRLEGHPTNYKRTKDKIILNNGRTINCWVYFYPHDTVYCDIVSDGVFQ